MNIVNRLTIRQLKLNKKRTLVTIIGTIISAAMITAVASLGLSFMNLMQRQSIANHGEWHVMYEKVNKSKLDNILSDSETKTTVISKDLGFSYLEGSQNHNKPYLFVKELNTTGYEKFPIKLIKGRLPKKSDEIVIVDSIRSNAKVDFKIDEKIKLSIGQRYLKEPMAENASTPQNTALQQNTALSQSIALQYKEDKVNEILKDETTKEYTVVGFIDSNQWEYTWSPGYTAISYIDENTVKPEETFDTYVIEKHVNNKLFDHVKDIATNNKVEVYEFNNDLLRYYGAIKDDIVKRILLVLSIIIMLIIVVGSVSLIYNAFAISVSERSRYLGMLSSVGATKRQKRNSVFFEGAVIGAISIPIGIAAGYLGLWITFLCINPIIKGALGVTENFQIKIYPSSLITAILISVGTILISTYLPAKKASRVSAIDAIRQTTDIKFNQKQVHTSKIIKKIFGIEGELGLKNLKRNRSRYRATVISIVISMVLFLVVSSFTDIMKKAVTMAQDGINFDIQTTIRTDNEKEKEEIIHKITSLNNIDQESKISLLIAHTGIEEKNIADFLKSNKNRQVVKKGIYPYNVYLKVLDEKSLIDYARKVGVDYQKLIDKKNPSAIVIDRVKFKDSKEDKYVETRIIKAKVGDQLDLTITNPDSKKQEKIKPVKIAALTNLMPMGVMKLNDSAGFHMIMSQEAYDAILQGKEAIANKRSETSVYFNSKNSMKLQESIEKIQNNVGESKISIFNVYIYKQREEQMILLLSVFSYAFIILITLICIANILNTVSTSIALRKREFAMLKSVGITPKGFGKMLNFESIFYGIKALLYGIPISIAMIYLMHEALNEKFDYPFTIPVVNLSISIASVFLIVGVAMLYSSKKVRKDTIIDALKQEII